MKSFRWTYLVVAVVAALVAFTIFDSRRAEQETERAERTKELIKFSSDDIEKLELKTRLSTTVVEKVGEAWRVRDGALDDKADEPGLRSFLTSIVTEKALEAVDGADLKAFGLDDPITRLVLRASGGREEEIRIGSVKAYDGSLYAQIDKDPTVWLVSFMWDAYLSKRGNDFREKSLLRQPLAFESVKRIRIRAGASETLVVKTDKWKVEKGLNYPVSDDRVLGFLGQLKSLKATNFLSSDVKPFQPAFEVCIFGEREYCARFSEKLKESKLETVQASSSDLKELVDMPQPVALTVKRTAQDFYDVRLPFLTEELSRDVARLKIETPTLRSLEFKKEGDAWVPADASLQSPIDTAKLSDVVKKLKQMEAARIIGPSAERLKNRLVLMKTDGATVFEISWNDRTKVKTNLNKFAFELSEKDLVALVPLVESVHLKKEE